MIGGIALKLSDYGLAMLFPIEHKEKDKKEQTDLYRDPQIDLIFAKLNDNVCKDLGYDATKADVWSLAVIMAQLYLDFDVMFSIFNRVWNEKCPQLLGEVFLERVKRTSPPKQLIDLLTKMFRFEQKERIDIISVCCHRWLIPTIDRDRRLTQFVIKVNNDNNKSESKEKEENYDPKSAQEVNEAAETVNDNYRLNEKECEKYITDDDDYKLVI